ncbi:small ribosomal subunit protein mS31 isoform X2 [Lethenteron reissneri]|uniref:small ribosomal subunit protein mS31 isoform X2 n=1 Tax=Lethenteron reissneri TaxID=7753 RepID=UPI002AB63A62|nr:small ribosomal subunit protein mS31 isoform X2 [Lethenteron reissneri]
MLGECESPTSGGGPNARGLGASRGGRVAERALGPRGRMSMARMRMAMRAMLLGHAARTHVRCGARGGDAERGLVAAWADGGLWAARRRVSTTAGGEGGVGGGQGGGGEGGVGGGQGGGEGGGGSPEERLLSVLGSMRVEVRTKRPLRPPPATEGGGERQRAAPRPVPPPLAAAARAVAEDVPGRREETESELLDQLRQHEAQSDAARRGDLGSLSDIISAMRVSRKSSTPSQSMNQIRFDEDWQGFQSHQHKREANEELIQRFNKRLARRHLNIFRELPRDDAIAASGEQQQQQQAFEPTLWELEQESAIAATVSHAPRNGFEEMIQWTEEGKLWLYPVNNEQGLEEEEAVPFHEHVFLERHLAEFPSSGPVRHFMQLVVTGLSKNPYLTVAQKREHIAWFREYFEKKSSILESAESA